MIDDTRHSPLTPADAAAAAGHSDTDVSSPGGQPAGSAAWARIGAYNKAKGPHQGPFARQPALNAWFHPAWNPSRWRSR